MFVNKNFEFIENLCAYTNSKYSPTLDKGIIYSKFKLGNFANFLYKVTWAEFHGATYTTTNV